MKRVYDMLVDAMAWMAAMLIFGIMVGVGIDVFSRSAFNQPVGWMYEIVQHSLLAILFLGSPWLTRQNGHVAIEIIVQALPGAFARAGQVVSFALAGATAAFIAAWAFVAAAGDFRRGIETIGIYPVPRGVLLAIISLGMLLTTVEFARLAIRAAKGAPQLLRPGGIDARF